MPDRLSRRALGRCLGALLACLLVGSLRAEDEIAISPAQIRLLGVQLLRPEQPGDIAGLTYPAVDLQRRELEAEIGANLTDAGGSLERWQFAEQARVATRDNAQLTQRAHAAGDADLQAVLLARRQSVDAALGARRPTSTRCAPATDCWSAHLIWGLQDE